MNNVTSNAANAAAEDWDISNGVGWGPDYQVHQLILIS